MFGKIASCKTTTMLCHFYIPQLGKYSCFSLSLRGEIVPMTWKTLVFLNDSRWRQTAVACAKYWSDPGKGWPVAGCSKWKLYVVQTAFWSGCIASCLIYECKNRDLPSAGKAEPSLSAPLSCTLSLILPLCTCSLTSCQITNALLILPFLYKQRKTCISDTHCTGCFTHRYYHRAELWGIPRGCRMSHHKDTVRRTLTGQSCSFINSA